MQFKYSISKINNELRWIYIDEENTPFDEEDAFIHLVKSISYACNGTIYEVGELQYRIKGDKHNLCYQWDDLFGIVVIYNEDENLNSVIKYIKSFF